MDKDSQNPFSFFQIAQSSIIRYFPPLYSTHIEAYWRWDAKDKKGDNDRDVFFFFFKRKAFPSRWQILASWAITAAERKEIALPYLAVEITTRIRAERFEFEQ